MASQENRRNTQRLRTQRTAMALAARTPKWIEKNRRLMFFFFPAGLVLYWITNNILSIVQQYVINKRLGVA